jgi:hypothetical protein
VTFWAEVFLGVIALATLTMAVVHVSVIVGGWMMARRVNRLLAGVEQQMQPLIESVNAIAQDAARVTALATTQAEKVDRLVTDLSVRIEQTANTVQDAVLKPLRDGAAMLAGVRAAIDVFRDVGGRRGAGRTRPEEEDALFIG